MYWQQQENVFILNVQGQMSDLNYRGHVHVGTINASSKSVYQLEPKLSQKSQKSLYRQRRKFQ